jgi:hypothetical protein
VSFAGPEHDAPVVHGVYAFAARTEREPDAPPALAGFK